LNLTSGNSFFNLLKYKKKLKKRRFVKTINPQSPPVTNEPNNSIVLKPIKTLIRTSL